ncbi:MAG: hypothetical protein GXP55_04070 [Deltaproteobacteria bacterium]|nr:hypothetical protein [Deltaproteobacteria bacterium]
MRGVALTLLAGVGLSVWVTQTDWGRERMRRLAVSVIQRELGLQATLGEVRVDLSYFPPGVAVHATDIALDDPVYGHFVEAQELTIEPSLEAFLAGELDLETIRIDHPTIHLVVRDGEVRNLPRTRSTPEGETHLPFSRIEATSATVIIDAQPFADARIEDLDLSLSVEAGRRVSLRADASGGEIVHALGTEHLQRLLIDGEVDPDEEIELRRFVLRTGHLRVGVSNFHLPLPFDSTWAGEVTTRVDLGHLRHLPLGVDLPPIDGLLELRADVNGTTDGPIGQGDLRLTNAHIDTYGLGDRVELAVDFDPHGVRVPAGDVHLIRDGGVVHIEGGVSFDGSMAVHAQIGIEHLEFAKLMAQLGVTPDAIVQWDLSGPIALSGTLNPLNISGPIAMDTRNLRITQDAWHVRPQRHVLKVSRARLEGGISIRPDGLRFEHLEGDTPRSHISGHVLLGFSDHIEIAARLTQLDLEDVTPLLAFQLAGRGELSIDIEGPYGDPQVQGHTRLAGFVFGGFPLGDVESDFRLEGGGFMARFPSIVAVKGQSHYRMDDLLLDFRDHRFAATTTMVATRVSLADLYRIFHFDGDERFESYQAIGSGRVGIRFTNDYPGDGPHGTMLADIDMDVSEADIDGYHYTDGAFVGRWRWVDWQRGYEGGVLTIDHAHLHKSDGVVTLSGEMGLDGELRLSAVIDQMRLHDVEGLRDNMPALDGTIGAAVEVRGTPDSPRADMDVTITGLTWAGTLIGDGRTYIRLTDEDDPWVRAARGWDPAAPPPDEPCAHARAGFARARFRPDPPYRTSRGPVPRSPKQSAYIVCGEGANGQIVVDMAFGRTSVIPLRGLVRFAGLKLDSLLQAQASDETLRGEISGDLLLTGGAMFQDDSLVGELRLPRLAVSAGAVSVQNVGDVVVALNGRRGFSVERARLSGSGSTLDVSGTGLMRGGLALRVDGALDLALLATLSPRLTRASGAVGMQVNITGAFDDPAVFGEARVEDASFHFADFPAPIRELDGQVTFSAHRILFEDFEARFAGGSLSLGGSASLRAGGIDRYAFNVGLSGLSLSPEPGLELAFGGDTRLTWHRGQRLPLLDGNIHLDRVRYTKPVSLSPTIGELNHASRLEVDRYDPDADKLSLDLRLTTRAPIRIENNVFDADVVIQDSDIPFRIVGTDQRFGVVGALGVPRGQVRLRGTELSIQRADIDFDDPTRIDPQFDVTATTEVHRATDPSAPNYRIQLRAHGNLDGFRLDLSSDPQMGQEDIILLLTLGMTRSEAEQLQAGNIGAAGLEALSNVTGVNDEVTRAVGVIDEFGITTFYSQRTGRPEPFVSIGKRISDRVRLTAATALTGNERDVRASAEWRVGDQTSVEAVYDSVNRQGTTFGNLGVDLRWRLEFE